jgi:chitinase
MFRICVVIISLVLLPSVLPRAVAAIPSKPIVVGYIFSRDKALPPGQIDANSITRINYAFANIKDGRMVAGCAADAENLARLTALRRQNPSLTVLVSVGGWLWSTNFSDVSLTAQSRQLFIQSVMDFLGRYNLDGLDIDWEYPGMVGAGNTFRGEDKHNFTLLLKDLRKRFSQETKLTHRRLYITIAAGATNKYLAHTEMKNVQKYVDTVNLMAYDYVMPGVDPLTGHHAPLFTNPADARNYSSDASVRAFEQAGVPTKKILLGMPFYSHVWSDVAERDHGLFQPGKPAPNGYAPSSIISGTMLDQGFVRYWDATASAPYLYNAEKHIFVSYEDTQSITAKCRYVLDHKLGGVMFWEYFSDSTGTLLNAINQSLRGHAAEGKDVQ